MKNIFNVQNMGSNLIVLTLFKLMQFKKLLILPARMAEKFISLKEDTLQALFSLKQKPLFP